MQVVVALLGGRRKDRPAMLPHFLWCGVMSACDRGAASCRIAIARRACYLLLSGCRGGSKGAGMVSDSMHEAARGFSGGLDWIRVSALGALRSAAGDRGQAESGARVRRRCDWAKWRGGTGVFEERGRRGDLRSVALRRALCRRLSDRLAGGSAPGRAVAFWLFSFDDRTDESDGDLARARVVTRAGGLPAHRDGRAGAPARAGGGRGPSRPLPRRALDERGARRAAVERRRALPRPRAGSSAARQHAGRAQLDAQRGPVL